ncbi:MAG TPA: DinB family protein, partial [Pyrinomonadaceae bacterium]|nr:DinB family protein [Pyrinomonadaceae bacterium]
FASISEEKGLFAYAEGKWTIKEVLGHIIDAERVFAYRIFRISRKDETPLETFDENEYIANSDFNQRTIAEMLEEFSLLRRANLLLLNSFPDTAWVLRGTASGFPVSVRALAYIMFGHAAHHTKILQERYF